SSVPRPSLPRSSRPTLAANDPTIGFLDAHTESDPVRQPVSRTAMVHATTESSCMEFDPIAEAERLSEAIAELLEKAAVLARDGRERTDIRYAGALARTLHDQLAEMLRTRAAA